MSFLVALILSILIVTGLTDATLFLLWGYFLVSLVFG
jgi:hypothetical protein